MSSTDLNKKRIEVLDGFRCLAVVLVILMHYGTSYPEYYPYQSRFSNNFLFKNGYLGVHFFFMISGFVIFMTLEKCHSIKEFLFKRIARLFPSILFCSLLTYFVFIIFDSDNHFSRFHNSIIDFIPGLTFTDLWIWNLIFGKQVEYIDGVYWTLSYEMKFYILISVVYFFNKKNFFKNWTIVVVSILSLFFIITLCIKFKPYAFLFPLQRSVELLLFPQYIVLFTLGIYFYLLWNKRAINSRYKPLMLLLVGVELLIFNQVQVQIFLLIFIAAFLIFIYRPNWLNFLSTRFFTTIGLISYPLYLIHAHIGVMLISKITSIFDLKDYSILVIIIVIALLMIVAYLIHIYIENPSNKILRKLLFRK